MEIEKARYIMEKRNGIGIRILNTIVVLICFFFIVASAIDFSNSTKNQLEENISDSLKRNNEYLENHINGKVEDILSTLEAYSIFISTFDNIHDSQVFETLQDAQTQNKFLNITIDDLDGDAQDISGRTFSVADREYFKVAKQGKKVVSQVIQSKTFNQKCIAFAVPIYRNGAVVGVLHTSIALDAMQKHFNIDPVFVEGAVFVSDRSGSLIMGPKEMYNKEDFFKQLNKTKNPSDYGFFSENINGEQEEVYYAYEADSQWYIFTLIDKQLIQNQTVKTNQLAFILVIRIAILLLVLAYFSLIWDRKRNKEIKKHMEEMNTIVNNAPGGAMCYLIDHGKTTLQFISDGACEIFGLNVDEAHEKLRSGYSTFIKPEDMQPEMLLSSKESSAELYYRVLCANGQQKWVVDRRCFIKEKELQYVYISILDVTNMMHMQEEIQVSDAKQRMIIEGTNLMYFDYDIEKKEIHFSKGWMEFSGYPEKVSTLTKDPRFLVNLDVANVTNQELLEYVKEHGHTFQSDDKVSLMDGSRRWIRIKGSIILDQRNVASHIIAIMEDIDGMKRAHEELEVKTKIDALTGIYNKVSAETLIKQKLMDTTLLNQQVLFVIDVDDFKEVNDTHGHLEGDEVLSQLGFKLNSCFRKDDVVGRIGGDEFIALMSDVKLDAQCNIEEKAKQIVHAIEEVKGLEGNVNITCSIGIACYPKDATNFDELFKKADAAMYQMKESGKSSYHFYKE